MISEGRVGVVSKVSLIIEYWIEQKKMCEMYQNVDLIYFTIDLFLIVSYRSGHRRRGDADPW